MPEAPFEFAYLEDDIARFYQNEQNLARIFSYSAAFALLIACLGVYGLVSLDAARRTREVGIRKVMGAAAGDIVSLLSRQFVVLMATGLLTVSVHAFRSAMLDPADALRRE